MAGADLASPHGSQLTDIETAISFSAYPPASRGSKNISAPGGSSLLHVSR